jgi:thioesterase domain-containing protein
LFCFGIDSGPVYIPLAQRLGSDQPLFCVGLTPSDTRQLVPPYKLEDIASHMVKKVRELQPHGPYYFGGLCSGGLIAFEAARQLADEGHRIALIALFEPQTPSRPDEHSRKLRFDWMAQRIKFHVDNARQLRPEELWPYIRNRLTTLSQYARGVSWRNYYQEQSINNRRPQNVAEIVYLASRAYRPQPYAGTVTLFQATKRPGETDWDRQCWRKLASAVDIHQVPGYSNWVVQFFVEPNVGLLAERLKGSLARSTAESDPGENKAAKDTR